MIKDIYLATPPPRPVVLIGHSLGVDAVPGHPMGLWGFRHTWPEHRFGDQSGALDLDERFTDHKIANYIRELDAIDAVRNLTSECGFIR